MSLLQNIRIDHTRRKDKRPYRRSPYAVVSAIVAKFGLNDDFVQGLAIPPEVPGGNAFVHGPFRRKKRLAGPLFSLAERRQYDTARKILEVVNNPYLSFACSPDELSWAGPLFAANPRVRTELLETHHFETLYLAEIAKARIASFSNRLQELSESRRAGGKPRRRAKRFGPEASEIDNLRGQIKMLNDYILFVQNPNASEGE